MLLHCVFYCDSNGFLYTNTYICNIGKEDFCLHRAGHSKSSILMADNYLEKKFEETFGYGAKKKVIIRRSNPSLDTLFRRNRSVRGYDRSVVVTESQLREIISVNSLVASSMNRQALRFRPLTQAGATVMPHLRFGAMLPELHLPFPGTEPDAFIVVCTFEAESPLMYIDLGISLQSMSLKAVEIGLNCLIVRAFNQTTLASAIGLEDSDMTILAVLAVGKSAESIYLKPVAAGDSLKYYRKEGVQYVPKLQLDDLII